jgi:protein PhnA
MTTIPNCPKCHCEYAYPDGEMYICPNCQFEWSLHGNLGLENKVNQEKLIKDANGNLLNEGDFVTVVKDLKIKGSSSVLKVGTKAKILRFLDGDHDLDCKVDGMGAMELKSGVVKKIF